MNTWIMRNNSAQKTYKCRLFCFPFAGGSASTYKDWAQGLPDFIELCPINLPGRGFRFNEEAHSTMNTLINALVKALLGELTLPYFFFGHSMGTMVAFELCRALRLLGKELPRHLFLSARPGPSCRLEDYKTQAISDEDLINMLAALNGTDKDILANQELLDFMLPALRADMNIVQTHRYADERALDQAITVFGGSNDPTVQEQELLQWRLQTTSSFRLHMLVGDHFFLNNQREILLKVIAQTIEKDLQHEYKL